MKKFTYVARSLQGELKKGVVYGNDRLDCLNQLRANRLYPIQVKSASWQKWKFWHITKVMSYAEVCNFCKQFAVLLHAGIAIPLALKLLSGQKTSPHLEEVITDLLRALEEGETLFQGFSKYRDRLPPFFCSLVRAGEMTNSLEAVFERLAQYYDQEDQFRKQLQQLMTYPFILTLSTMGVVFFLFLKIIPQFSEMYESFDAQLPFLTHCLLSISRHVTTYLRMYVIGFLLSVSSLSYLFHVPKVKNWLVYIQYTLPLLGGFQKKILAARLARTWSLLLANGLEVLPAVELTLGTSGVVADNYLQQIAHHVKQGFTLTHSLQMTRFFPDIFLEMVKVGEESGALATMLARIAEIYEKDARTLLERFLTVLEPALLLGIALIVGVIVLAVLLPMFEMIKLF